MENLVRKRVVNIAKIGIGIGLLIFLIYYVNPSKILETFGKANRVYVLIAFSLLPLNLFLQYFRWKLISEKYFGIKAKGKIWLSIFYGISGGIFTPMKSGEYFARALPFKNVKVLDVLLATLVDKLIPIFFLALIGGSFFILFMKNLLELQWETTIVILATYKILILFSLYLVFGNNTKSNQIIAWLKSKKYFKKIIERISFIKTLSSRIVVKLFIASFFSYLTYIVQMTLLLVAFTGELNFAQFFYTANLIMFAQIIIPPIALGEVGVREGAAVFFLQNLGYAGVVGFNAAISLFFINLLLPSIVGLLLLLRRN